MRFLGRLLDTILAVFIGALLGSYMKSDRVRYIWLATILGMVFIFSQHPDFEISMIAIGAGALSTISLQRAWARNENRRRRRFEKDGIVIQDQLPDLRREGVLSIAVLVLLSAVLFARLHTEYGWFGHEGVGGAGYWLLTSIDQFFRSLLLDLFEVYRFDTFEIEADQRVDQTVVFAVRVIFTFVVISTVIENFRIRSQLKRSGRRAFSKGNARVEVLIELGDRAQEAIKDMHIRERKAAVKALSARSGMSVLNALISFLKDREASVKALSVEGIARLIGDANTDGEDGERRHKAIEQLSHTSQNDPHRSVRSQAKKAVRPYIDEYGFRKYKAEVLERLLGVSIAWREITHSVRLLLKSEDALESEADEASK